MKKSLACVVLFLSTLNLPVSNAQDVAQTVNCSVFGNFTVINNVITKNSNCAGQIIIPDQITEIAEYAFENNKNIDSVIFGSGQINIRNYAFSGASGIKKLTIPANVTSIGWGAFNGLSGLEILNLNATRAVISDNNFNDLTQLNSLNLAEGISTIPGNSFTGAKLLENLTIPSTVKKILANSFSSASNLKNLELKNGLIELGYGSLRNLNSISEIRIPKSVEVINQEALSAAKSVQAFVVDRDNPFYASDGEGGLYDKNLTNLILSPLGKSKFEIPTTVKFITKGAFGIPDFPAKSLSTLNIPTSVIVVDPELRSMVASETSKKLALEKAVTEQFTALLATLNRYKADISRIFSENPVYFKQNPEIQLSLQRAIDYVIPKVASQSDIEAIRSLIEGGTKSALASDYLIAQSGIKKYRALEMKQSKEKMNTKTTVFCIKGKLTKKLTGTNLKCPSGYKKVQTAK